MSKRLISNERLLDTPGREDVMKRVFLFLYREKPAAEMVGGGGGQLQHWVRHNPTHTELLLPTASIQRIVIYLVSYEKHRGEASVVMEDVGILSKVSPRDLLVVHAQSSVGPSGACWCIPLFMLGCLKGVKFKCCTLKNEDCPGLEG